MPLQRVARAFAVVAVLGSGLLVGGCESLTSFENFFNTKKKLPGERKDLFPEGVPGVSQGVPQELIKGNQPPPDAPGAVPTAAAPAPAPEPVAEEEKPKPKPKPRVVSRPKPPKPKPQAAPAAQEPESDDPAPDAVWPAPARQPAQQQTPPPAQSPWPSAPAQQTQQRPASTPWPEPPAAGTFSR